MRNRKTIKNDFLRKSLLHLTEPHTTNNSHENIELKRKKTVLRVETKEILNKRFQNSFTERIFTKNQKVFETNV